MNGLLKKVLIVAVVMAAVAAAGWFGRKVYHKSEEHRFLAQARLAVEKKDWRNAGVCLQRVMQINPVNVPASSMMADLLETAGSTNALTWRIRTAKLAAANVTNRFAWAQTALREKNLKSAAEAMGGVGEPSKSLPEYHKIAGALAWEQGRSAEAENQ